MKIDFSGSTWSSEFIVSRARILESRSCMKIGVSASTGSSGFSGYQLARISEQRS